MHSVSLSLLCLSALSLVLSVCIRLTPPSFGITLYEIMTRGEDPYPGKSESEVIEFVRNGGQMTRPSSIEKEVWEVMLNCWRIKPEGMCIVCLYVCCFAFCGVW